MFYCKVYFTQISDVEQIVGLMHVETIQIHAEAYDVAIDISFPRGTTLLYITWCTPSGYLCSGADGGLDFQCIRVGDEAKQSIQLKNKGKYDIEYKYAVCVLVFWYDTHKLLYTHNAYTQNTCLTQLTIQINYVILE